MADREFWRDALPKAKLHCCAPPGSPIRGNTGGEWRRRRT
jgi:hypothetical protein